MGTAAFGGDNLPKAGATETYLSSGKDITLVRLFQTVNKISKQRIKTK